MAEYIKLEDVIEITAETGALETQTRVMDLPSIDIVYCKDCINVCQVGNETQLLCQCLADRRGHYLNPSGYCSYGERRVDNDGQGKGEKI